MSELVKDSTVRLPKVTTSVERTLQKANASAKAQRWRKIIIIGEGPHGYHISNSKMRYYEMIGFIEYAKITIIEETRDA